MPKLNAFLDLDGPLLDVSERHHRVHAQIVAELGGRPVPREAFWAAKRQKVSDAVIARESGLTGEDDRYHRRKLELIEDETFLRFDRLQPGVVDALDRLRARFRLIVVTLRRHPERLAAQLDQLDLRRLLDDVLAASERADASDGWRTKVELTRGAGLTTAADDIFVGDTETDIRAGKALGTLTVAVTNGMREPELLLAQSPSLLLPSLSAVPAALGLDGQVQPCVA